MDRFLELKEGLESSRKFAITAESVDAYARLTGDGNPIHMDNEYARSAGFRGRVAHGMYLAGLLSRMIGEDVPGNGAIWFGQDLSFDEPVYVGDDVTITVRVTHLSAATRTAMVDVVGKDQNGNLKFKGKGKVTMPKIKEKTSAGDRIALVTGGSGGIGSAISKTLACNGMKVILAYAHNASRADGLVNDINKERVLAESAQLDLSDHETLRRKIRLLVARHGCIDTVVCGAMQEWRHRKFPELTERDFEDDMNVAVFGHAILLQELLPAMIERQFGRVIGIASSVVHGAPPAQQASYVMAKYAMVGLFRSLLAEYPGTGITFNLVAPSFVDTDMTKGVADRIRRAMIIQSPMGRLCTPEDVAGVVDLLARRESYINGASIPVTGGLNVGS